MTGTHEDAFKEIVTLVKEGQTASARAKLLDILQKNPHNVRAWILLARIAETPNQQRKILQSCLKRNPKSALAQRALTALDAHDDEQSATTAREVGKPDQGTSQQGDTTSPWPWLGIAGFGIVLVIAVLGAIFTMTPPAVTPSPTPTLPPPTATSTLTPTRTPQPTPTLTPTPTELEILETWLPPLATGSYLSSTCGSLLSMSRAITAEVGTLEYEFEVKLGVGVISAMESELGDLSLDTWKPPGLLAPYKEKLETQTTSLREIADQWIARDLTPEEIPNVLSETCTDVRETRSQLVADAEREGFTEAQLMNALLEARSQEDQGSPPTAPTEIGASRANPYPVDAVASADQWLIQIREVVRGQAAWELIRDLPFAEPAPEDQEYLLVHVQVKNATNDTTKRSLNRHDFGVTGDRLKRYDADPFVAPAPEFDVNLPGGWETTGWLTFMVGVDEGNLILIFDPFFGDAANYLALEDNASIPMPTRRTQPVPNELGSEPGTPAPFGETVVTRDWSVTLLDAARGQEAWDLLEGVSIFNQPPPEGQAYLLVKAHVRYISRHEGIGEVNGYSFSTTKNPDASPPSVTGLHPPLAARLFPGGEVTGWFELLVPEGETIRVVFEPPMTLTGEQRRYLALP